MEPYIRGRSARNPPRQGRACRFSTNSLNRELAGLAARNTRRELIDTVREDGVWIRRGQSRYLSFSCNDYLGLSHHPRSESGDDRCYRTLWCGAGASRLVTGNDPLYAN